jgi:glycine/D-amino acid oxidase-like deaminating enzyme
MRNRREVATLLSMAALGGCATTKPPGGEAAAAPAVLSPALPPRGHRLVLAPVHVAEDRVIRTVVGLRPYRAAGFVVRGEKLGDKLLVHNYGHGGGGVTLSWGTSHLAVGLGHDSAVERYAVLGCGAVGLSTARLLQRRGGQVTIYAADLPPDTTSNIAGGQWGPFSVHDDSAGPEFMRHFTVAARAASREFQNMVGPHYGVRWTRNYFPQRPAGARTIVRLPPGAVAADGPPPPDPLEGLEPEKRMLEPGEHPFGNVRVRQVDSMMIEPAVYLQAVMEDFLSAGGRIVVRRFNSAAEIAALPERTVFNCTGLGARALFGDAELIPVRGQLVILLPQPEVNYNLLSGGLYMFPRQDGIVLGGTFERNDWSLEPRAETTARILNGHRALFAGMTGPA